MIELKITASTPEELATLVERTAHRMTGNNGAFAGSVESTTDVAETAPEPAPTPVAPAPTPVVETIAPGAIASAPAEVDERGVPWNEEFHASTKTKTNDGAWKKKRGGDPESLAAYEAQFTTVAPLSNPVTVTHPAPGFPSPVNTMPQSDDPEPAASVPGHPGVVQPAPTITPVDAAGVMKAASALIQNGTKTPAYLQQLAEGAGLNNIGEMFSNDDAVSVIADRLRADGFMS